MIVNLQKISNPSLLKDVNEFVEDDEPNWDADLRDGEFCYSSNNTINLLCKLVDYYEAELEKLKKNA